LTLSSIALERNFPKLPSDLDIEFLNNAKDGLNWFLMKKCGSDCHKKIVEVNRILSKFKDGTICRELNCRENWWAARLVLLELNGNKAIKEAIV